MLIINLAGTKTRIEAAVIGNIFILTFQTFFLIPQILYAERSINLLNWMKKKMLYWLIKLKTHYIYRLEN